MGVEEENNYWDIQLDDISGLADFGNRAHTSAGITEHQDNEVLPYSKLANSLADRVDIILEKLSPDKKDNPDKDQKEDETKRLYTVTVGTNRYKIQKSETPESHVRIIYIQHRTVDENASEEELSKTEQMEGSIWTSRSNIQAFPDNMGNYSQVSFFGPLQEKQGKPGYLGHALGVSKAIDDMLAPLEQALLS